MNWSSKSAGREIGLRLVNGSVGKYLLVFLSCFAPLTEPGAEEARQNSFTLAEPNERGEVSIEGFERSLQMALTIKTKSEMKGNAIFAHFQRSYHFSFARGAAWKFHETTSASSSSSSPPVFSFVTADQWRILHVYLCAYAAMYDAYFGFIKDENTTMGIKEWTTRCGKVAPYKNYGFVGFSLLSSELKGNALGTAAFFYNRLDSSEDKRVDLQEWISFIEKAEVTENTDLGTALSERPLMPDTITAVDGNDDGVEDDDNDDVEKGLLEDHLSDQRNLTSSLLSPAMPTEKQGASLRESPPLSQKQKVQRIIAWRKKREFALRAAAKERKHREYLEWRETRISGYDQSIVTATPSKETEHKGKHARNRRKKRERKPPVRKDDGWEAATLNCVEGSAYTMFICSLVLICTAITGYIGTHNCVALLTDSPSESPSSDAADSLHETSVCSIKCVCGCAPTPFPTSNAVLDNQTSNCEKATQIVILITVTFVFEVLLRLYLWRTVHGIFRTFFISEETESASSSMREGESNESKQEELGDSSICPTPSIVKRIKWLNVIDVAVVGSDIFFFVMTLLSDAAPVSFVMARIARLLRLFKCCKTLKLAKQAKVYTARQKLKAASTKRAMKIKEKARVQTDKLSAAVAEKSLQIKEKARVQTDKLSAAVAEKSLPRLADFPRADLPSPKNNLSISGFQKADLPSPYSTLSVPGPTLTDLPSPHSKYSQSDNRSKSQQNMDLDFGKWSIMPVVEEVLNSTADSAHEARVIVITVPVVSDVSVTDTQAEVFDVLAYYGFSKVRTAAFPQHPIEDDSNIKDEGDASYLSLESASSVKVAVFKSGIPFRGATEEHQMFPPTPLRGVSLDSEMRHVGEIKHEAGGASEAGDLGMSFNQKIEEEDFAGDVALI